MAVDMSFGAVTATISPHDRGCKQSFGWYEGGTNSFFWLYHYREVSEDLNVTRPYYGQVERINLLTRF
jgi:hypothetical protein